MRQYAVVSDGARDVYLVISKLPPSMYWVIEATVDSLVLAEALIRGLEVKN